MTGSAVPAVKAALFNAALTLWPQATQAVKVTYGHPGIDFPAQFVFLGSPQSDYATAVMNRTTRPRDETITVPIVLAAEVGGGPEAQQTATEAAYALLATFVDWLRTNPTLGLDQVTQSRNAVIVGADAHETDADDFREDGQRVMDFGRCCDITILVQTIARI